VSKAAKRHCVGTVQSQGGRVGNVKQVGFEPRPEDSYGRCRRDMIRQTVPYASTISDEDELERSRRRASTSATWQSSSVRYMQVQTREDRRPNW